MFSSTIKVPVSTLTDVAEKIYDYAEDTADVFDRMANYLNRISGHAGWEGLSMREIMAATEKNQKKYRDLVTELKNLSGFLENFALEMEAKDQEIKANIESA